MTELNCLAKWDGTKYVQINLDTGATSVEVTGDGNALDGVTYDPATRKLTFRFSDIHAGIFFHDHGNNICTAAG